MIKLENRQKEIMVKLDLPHSPPQDPSDLPPLPTFYNPWEEIGGPSMMFGASQFDDDIEHDFGGREESHTPTEIDTDEDDDNSNDDE